MRATILPWAIVLTKAQRAAVSIMTQGCILAKVLPLRCFLSLLPNHIHVYAITMEYFTDLDKREVLQQEYFQPPILPSSHFQQVLKLIN